MRDDRIPVRFATAAEGASDEVVLVEPSGAALHGRAAGHLFGCACCVGRSALAVALGALFQDRALGRVAWFRAVVAVVADPAAAAETLRADRLVAARFRVVP